MGVGVQFERFHDKSRLLQGAISSLQVWDPDLSKDTSDRNRRILKMINDSGEEQSLLPVFAFQYRTFNGQESHVKGTTTANMSLPRWVEERAIAGDIDDFLSIKLSPIEFNYLRERSAELADYLNNGLPGKWESDSYVTSAYLHQHSTDLFVTSLIHSKQGKGWVQHQKQRKVSVRVG